MITSTHINNEKSDENNKRKQKKKQKKEKIESLLKEKMTTKSILKHCTLIPRI